MRREYRRAFTLIELLVVISILALLIAVLIPSLSRARAGSRATVCASRLRELARGFVMYGDGNGGYLAPMRPPDLGGGTGNEHNYYDVGNGKKYRPRWAVLIGSYVGAHAFPSPESKPDRDDFVHEVYHCPEAPEWTDERNFAYGYNYQFLGNSRTLPSGRFINFPVNVTRVRNGQLVIIADAMGTAGGFPARERGDYENDGATASAMGNHGYTLDPPRLTAASDHGTGDANSRRSAVHPRHMGKVNAVFADAHAEALTDESLGYRRHEDGRYVDLDSVENKPINVKFSLSGRDDEPPRKQ
ncbi:MAG: prepilin-type N-terminal cleavage/methylation domain-containing protein [Phycisphaerae bacterium]|nr:MAG: type II secretion system protein [Planctomycetota bacterium]KAB2938111.1 MAG: prepilin-type N-terminal cleavage/methylation domain-containing protein [Phycisphaerae bacterium]MBE7455591.1 prepilin-type N-terminal cleavage/methylation domain-containing protein [Planctomycetia bacterium]MCK6463228.1 prepilin-type N-terminal cleavage/methylation domain-containing protein [Phycisphaerae bacterium]MCL4716848.1 prepilin-type N-terminal cleavage/methylation domain-containing protein [Phycispha